MRQVIVLSGISGSGKSTYADKLLQQTQGVKVSADHYFMREGGYHFDASKLGEAHADCFRRFISYLLAEPAWSCVVVDNTNTRVEELSPYVLGATAFGYTAEIITLMPTLDQVKACWVRNTHQVPLRTVEQQYHNLVNRKLPPYWKHIQIQL